MSLWKTIQESRLIVKVALVSVAILAAIGLLVLPLLTVDAGETAARGVDNSGLAFMARQEATGGIILLGAVIVLIIVGGTLRVINQDRIHRPHLMGRKKQAKEE